MVQVEPDQGPAHLAQCSWQFQGSHQRQHPCEEQSWPWGLSTAQIHHGRYGKQSELRQNRAQKVHHLFAVAVLWPPQRENPQWRWQLSAWPLGWKGWCRTLQRLEDGSQESGASKHEVGGDVWTEWRQVDVGEW